MKTAHDFSKASPATPVWWSRIIWWLEALALLVIMIVISAFRALQERQIQTLEEEQPGVAELDFAGFSPAV